MKNHVKHQSKASNLKRSKAMKASWERRKANKAALLSGLDIHHNTPIDSNPYELVADVLETLKVKPELLTAAVGDTSWDVHACRTAPEGFNISILKR